MSGAGFEIRVDDAEVQAALGAALDRLGDLTPAMLQIASLLESEALQAFEGERDPETGAKWLPSRRAKKEGGQTLTQSGQLRASITSRAGAMEAQVGSNKVYAGVHQFGGDINVPARTQTVRFRLSRWKGKSGREHVEFKPGFAKAKAKAADFERDVEVGAYTVKMPARPFLGVSPGGRAEILAIIADHVGGLDA